MKTYLIIFLLFFTWIGFAYTQGFDPYQIWTRYSVKYSINKKWNAYGESQFRFDNNTITPNPFLLEFAARNKLSKVSSIKLQYRHTWLNNERNTQRLALDGKFKWKLGDKKWAIQYRTRIQVERVNFNGQIISDWRNKVGIERIFSKKFSMYLDYENFIRVIKLKSFVRTDPPRFNQNRFTLGSKYQFKKNEFKAFYRIDQASNLPIDLFHIFGLGITHNLN